MTAERDGPRLAHEVRGAGVPLLLLHGFPHDRTLWAPQLAGLGGVARCIAPDLRGFGASVGPAPRSMDRHADDAVALLDALGVRRAVVCGLSMGGYVALALWRRHPARVRALVLADTRPDADGEEARERRRALLQVAREQGAAAVAERLLDGMVGKTTRRTRPAVVARVRAMLERAPVPGIVGALEAMLARPDSTPDLATIRVPTLVVVGDEDALTPPAVARAMHEQIAGSTLAVLAGAGHVSNLEQPAAFDDAVRGLLATLPPEEATHRA